MSDLSKKLINGKALDALTKKLNDKIQEDIKEVDTKVSTHNHDDKYYTESEIDTKLADKADKEHGTHLTLGTGSENAFRGDYGNTAYTHSQAAHAPSNAQKNSDITKTEIEAKLTGNITTHTHSQYLTQHQSLSGYATQTYVNNQITALVDSAPDAMNTLNELAAAIKNHNDEYSAYVSTVSNALAGKAPLSHTTDTTVHITAAERTAWNAKSNLTLGTTSSTAYRGDYGNTAYTHSQTAHAPSNAQKNSDITKAEIEAKLTGFITSHEHLKPQPGNNFVNGYAGMTADGIMECGKYQDWHNTDEETIDFSLRVQLDHSNANTVLWPTNSGRLALQSDIDNKLASINTQLSTISKRFMFRGNVGSNPRYYLLANFEVDGSSNFGNVTINGRMGRWEKDGLATYNILLCNRSGAREGRDIASTVSVFTTGDVTQALAVCDLVYYRQEDTSGKLYIKAVNYTLWDIDIKAYQHVIAYDETFVTTEPGGELVWTLSGAQKTIQSNDGTLSQTGTPIADNNLVTKAYTDSTYVLKENPVFTGTTFSFGRQSDSTAGNNSVAIGASSIASGECSTAIGYDSTASGNYSVGIGYGSVASGQESIALGNGNNSSGKYAFTVGKGNKAKSEYSIAMGCWNTSEATMGTALGNAAVTKKGWGAFSSGVLTTATGLGQHVFGVNNIPDEDPADELTYAQNIIIVGNGDLEGNKSNAYTLDKDGNGWFAGKVTAGAAPTDNMDLTTKEYVDASISEISKRATAITTDIIDKAFTDAGL